MPRHQTHYQNQTKNHVCTVAIGLEFEEPHQKGQVKVSIAIEHLDFIATKGSTWQLFLIRVCDRLQSQLSSEHLLEDQDFSKDTEIISLQASYHKGIVVIKVQVKWEVKLLNGFQLMITHWS